MTILLEKYNIRRPTHKEIGGQIISQALKKLDRNLTIRKSLGFDFS